MLFNSLTFVVFFTLVVFLYWSMRSWNARKNLLVVASYIFYGAWNPPFAALLFSTTAMDFWLGRRIAKAKGRHSRRGWLVGSVCMNLSMLGFFKYGNFLLQNFQWLLARIGIIYPVAHDSRLVRKNRACRHDAFRFSRSHLWVMPVRSSRSIPGSA